MKVFAVWILAAAACTPVLAPAQQNTAIRSPQEDYADRVMREWLLRQPAEDKLREEIAKRRDAEYREREFAVKANKFVERWSTFVREYNQKRAFNVKAAKDVSRAFRDLEKSGGWAGLK